MTSKRRMQLRSILQSLHANLLLEIADALRAVRTDTPIAPFSDILDRAEHMQDEDVTYELLRIKTAMLHRIEDALGRLDAGSFGVCADCEQEIAEQRLKAVPFATRCTECQQASEMGAHIPVRTPRTSLSA